MSDRRSKAVSVVVIPPSLDIGDRRVVTVSESGIGLCLRLTIRLSRRRRLFAGWR